MERVKALLRRENLIRGLGIVDQLTRLLRSTEPKPAEVQRPHINVSECQVTLCTGLPSRGRAGHQRGPVGKLEAACSWADHLASVFPSDEWVPSASTFSLFLSPVVFQSESAPINLSGLFHVQFFRTVFSVTSCEVSDGAVGHVPPSDSLSGPSLPGCVCNHIKAWCLKEESTQKTEAEPRGGFALIDGI